MADIRINDLPNEATPNPSEFLAIDGASTRKATIQLVVNAGAPVASQAYAEAGVDNNSRMTALSTKQSIDFNSVPLSRTVTAGSGLMGGGSLSSNISIALSSTSLTSLGLANTAVQPSRQVIAGTGISGGGSLSADVTLNLSAATQTSLGLANTAIQDGSNALVPNGGTSGQVLVKNSNTNRDTGWATIAAATAVSYAAQSLNATQQAQARTNIGTEIKGYISPDFNLSNNTTDAVNDIDFPSGTVASEQSPPFLMVHSAGTAQLDVAYGVGNGGRFDASISDGWWHCFIISNGTTVSRGFSKSLNPTAQTNYPSGFTHYRRVASWSRVSGSLSAITQRGDDFEYQAPIVDRSSTAAQAPTLLTLSVPTGVFTQPKFRILQGMSTSGNIQTLVASAGKTEVIFANTTLAGEVDSVVVASGVFTNTSAQIRFAVTAPGGGTLIFNAFNTDGWIDKRGRT